MDEMTKKLKSLEKETAQWKQRWEKSNSLLLDMATEKKQRDAELLSTTKQLTQLEKLCRALQTERATFINEIKSLKIAAAADPEVTHSEKIPINDVLTLSLVEQASVEVVACPIDTDENSVKTKENNPTTILLPLSYATTICDQREVLNSSYSSEICCTDSSVENCFVNHHPSQSQVHPPSSETVTIVAPVDLPSQVSASATIN